MELLQHINSLKYKDSMDLLPTVYAINFMYTPPRRETIIFTLGSCLISELSTEVRKEVFTGTI